MYSTRNSFLSVGMVMLALGAAVTGTAAEKARIDYGRDVRPILSENCFHCHGQDSRSGWRVCGSIISTARQPTRRPRRTFPGQPERAASSSASRPSSRPGGCPRFVQPQPHTRTDRNSSKALDRGGRRVLKALGFRPASCGPRARIEDRRWVKQPIDAFVCKRLEAEGLQPAARRAAHWLRRVSLDLTGLPPSPAEVDDLSEDVKTRGRSRLRLPSTGCSRRRDMASDGHGLARCRPLRRYARIQ